MGTEGNEDQEDGNLAIKGERKQHRHHSKSHKHRKNKAHHASGGTSEKDGLKHQEKITGLSQLKPLTSDSNKKYREFPRARGKRSSPNISQWQKILNTLKQGETEATIQSNAEESNTESNAESDTGRQLEILEAIQHQLEKEIANSEGARRGHHRQHPSMDIEAKKEGIQVLKEIEHSLQQTPPTEDNQAMMTGAHTHSSSHHHKHGQLQEVESKPLNDASNQAHNSHSHGHSKPPTEDNQAMMTGAHTHSSSHHHKHGQLQEAESKLLDDASNQAHNSHSHGHSKPSTHTEAKPNLDELEKQVFKDILKAESDGLTRKQGIELEREIENLEEIEKQTTEDLIENSDSQTK